MLSLLESNRRVAIDLSDFDFLRLFKDENEKVYFRLIQEEQKYIKTLKCYLNKDEYEKIKKQFKQYQKNGYSVNFVVHSGGTKEEEINRVNAFMLDVDLNKDFSRNKYEKQEIAALKVKFLEALKKFGLEPSCIIETKNGFHIYWLTRYMANEPCEKELWQKIEKAFVEYFQDNYEPKFPERIDKTISNFTKIMRVNGFLHLKDPHDPFLVKCIFLNKENKYTKEQIIEAINYKEPESVIKQYVPANSVVNEKHPAEHKTAFSEVIHLLRGIDLVSYLNLKVGVGKNFKCHYHDDKSPSAAIFYKNGEYRYFCNSGHSNCDASGHGLDIIDIVKMQLGYDTNQAIKYLKDSYGIKSSWEVAQSYRLTKNMEIIDNILINKDSEYKNLRKMLSLSYNYIAALYQECKEKLHDCFTLNGDNLFFVSNAYLANKMGKKKADKTNQYINLMCALGLVNKIKYENLDKKIIDKALELAEKKHRNAICFYNIPALSNEVLMTAEERAELMYKNGFSIKGISRVYVAGLWGEEFANTVYQVKFERTDSNTAIFDFLALTINKSIKEQGYFTKDMLYAANLRLSKGKRFGLDKLEFEYRRNLPDLLDGYDLILLKKPLEIKARGINTKKNVIVKA